MGKYCIVCGVEVKVDGLQTQKSWFETWESHKVVCVLKKRGMKRSEGENGDQGLG